MKKNPLHQIGMVLLVFISFVSIGSLAAQTSLKIKKTNNEIIDYPLHNIKNIKFNSVSTFQINKGVSSDQYALTGISKMYFGTSITSAYPVVTSGSKTRLYPIPVKDQFTLEIDAKNGNNARIEIIDFAGRVVSTQKVNLTLGVNSISMNSAILKEGFYLCKISLGNAVTEIIKFNKK